AVVKAFSEYRLELDEVERQKPKLVANKNEVKVSNEKAMAEDDKNIETISPKNPSPIRTLAYMFLSLPYHSKVTIAVNLNLIDDSDKDLSDVQKSQIYFKRAQEKSLLSQLWDEVIKESK